jgi:tetratricopeptide (TPR) repeat protein
MDGLYYINKLGPFDDDVEASTEKAIEKLTAAIAADPDWAPPRHELGGVYAITRHDGDPGERLQTARGHFLDALRLDENYGPAHGSLAYLLAIEGDYAGSMREYNRAEELGSDSPWGKAILYRILGRHSEAIAEFHAAAVENPLELTGLLQLFETYYCAGEAARTVDGLTEFFPELKGGYFAVLLAKAYARSGDIPNALQLANEFVSKEGIEAPMAPVFALAGETERARRALDSTDETEPFLMLDAAPAGIILGDYERALDLLERAAGLVETNIDERYNWLWRLHCDPAMQKLAGNPRYVALLDRFGLPH